MSTLKKILLIDDNDLVRDFVRRVLVAAGHTVGECRIVDDRPRHPLELGEHCLDGVLTADVASVRAGGDALGRDFHGVLTVIAFCHLCPEQ